MAKVKNGQNLSAEELLEQALVPENEQPYKVPANWVWTRLADLSSIISKGTTPKGGFDSYTNEGVTFLRVENIDENGKIDLSNIKYIDEETHKGFLKRSILAEGDILISIAGTLGRTSIVEKEHLPLNTNQAIAFIRLKDQVKVSNRYIEKVLGSPSIHSLLLDQTKVTSIPNLTLEIISNCVIPFPPLDEQQRIVERIEGLFAKLDQAKELAQNALESFEKRKAAILHKAFSGELTAKWREEHGVSVDSWQDTTLQEHTSILGDGIHGTPKYSEEGEYFFINGNNFDGHTIVIKPETKRVDFEEYKKHKKNLSKETVFVSINGTLGKSALYNGEPVILGKSACYFNVRESLDKHFIRYYLETKEFLDYAHNMATGSTIKNLSLKAMRNLPLQLPTLNEQLEIVRILDNLIGKEKEAEELINLIEKIDLMKKAVLARAFRSELGTNDPCEESAMELLKDVLYGELA